jgi:phage-related protein
MQVSMVALSKQMEAARGGTATMTGKLAELGKAQDAVRARAKAGIFPADVVRDMAKVRAEIDRTSAAGGKNMVKDLDRLGKRMDALRERGIKANARELESLAKKMQSAQGAGAKAQKVMTTLGVSMADVGKGNTQAVLEAVADRFKTMTNPAERAALAQKVFGRSGQALVPILMKGAAGVRQLLDEQKASGNYIGGKGIDNAKKMIEQQRELDRTVAGLKIRLGTALMPVLIQIGKVLVTVSRVIAPLTRNTTLFTLAIGALTAAIVAYKAAMVVATIQQTEFNAAALANPYVLVAAAIVGLVVGLVVLYKKWKWFHNLVDATWHWIKSHWPLLVAILLGPFAIAVLAIVKHWREIKDAALASFKAIKDAALAARDFVVASFNAIKAAALAVFNWVKSNWPLLVGALAGPIGVAVALIVTHFDTVKRVVGTVKTALIGGLGSAFDWIRQKATTAIGFVTGALDRLVQYVKDLPGKLGGALGDLAGRIPIVGGAAKSALGAATSVASHIPRPHLQHGGIVTRPGSFIVGERGPELVALPAGAAVSPTPEGFGGRALEVHVPVYLDRQVLARAVARVAADKLARK